MRLLLFFVPLDPLLTCVLFLRDDLIQVGYLVQQLFPLYLTLLLGSPLFYIKLIILHLHLTEALIQLFNFSFHLLDSQLFVVHLFIQEV
jgi:hypothetical protein